MTKTQAIVTFDIYTCGKAEITFYSDVEDDIQIIQGEKFVTLSESELEYLFEAYKEYKKANTTMNGGK